jgi:hypothetical protein
MNSEIKQIGKDGVGAHITEVAPPSWTPLSAVVHLCETLRIGEIREYYEQAATPELADEFYTALRHS